MSLAPSGGAPTDAAAEDPADKLLRALERVVDDKLTRNQTVSEAAVRRVERVVTEFKRAPEDSKAFRIYRAKGSPSQAPATPEGGLASAG